MLTRTPPDRSNSAAVERARKARNAARTPDRWRCYRPAVLIAPARRRCRCCGGSGIEPAPIDGAVLVSLIAANVGAREFATAELLRRARVVEGPLLAAMAGKNPQQIGRTLEKIAGQAFDGYRLTRARPRSRPGLVNVGGA